MQSNDYIDLSKYEIIDKIGEDSTGEMFLIKLKNVKSNEVFTAKIYKQTISKIKSIEKEISDISLLDHPSILKIIGFSPINFKKGHNPVIVTDYFPNYSLQKLIESEINELSGKLLDDNKKILILYGIASGMAYLHSLDIVQHILRPENIFLDSYLYPKINYFTLSKKFIYHPTYLDITPEGIESNEYSKKSDVYAFAYIAYQLITNQNPFPEKNMYEIAEDIQNSKRPEFDTDIINPKIKDLIERCWSQDPENRPSFDQIVIEIKNIEKSQEFLDYVEYVDDKGEPKATPFLFFENSEENDQKEEEVSNPICPKKIYNKLPLKCQELLDEAEIDDNCEQQYQVAVNFLNKQNKFPQNDEIGLAFLMKSIENGCLQAADFCLKGYLKESIDYIQSHLENPLFEYLNGFYLLGQHKFSEAAESLFKSSNNGFNKATHQLAEMYRDGIGFEADQEKATELYKKAKSQKKANSEKKRKISEEKKKASYKEGLQFLRSCKIEEAISIFESTPECFESNKKLSEIYFYGFQSIEPDIEKFIQYARIACKSNDIESVRLLSSVYEKDSQYKDHLLNIYLKGATNGDSDLMYKYALTLSKTRRQRQKLSQILQYIKMAADNGNQFAMYKYVTLNKNIGKNESNLYLRMAASFGETRSQEEVKSYQLKAKALKGDDPEAMFLYSQVLLTNKRGKEAMKFLQKAADGGNANAKKEITKIRIREIKIEIKNGDPKALGKLAEVLSEHNKYRKDIKEANDYLTKAARLYDINARIDLKNLKELKLLQSNDCDLMFNHAAKIEDEDLERSKFWYKKAADLGNEESMVTYAKILDRQVSENLREFQKYRTSNMSKEEYENAKIEAEYYFKKAADIGNVVGMSNYARILDHKVRDYQKASANHRRTKITEQESKLLQKESAKYFKKAADSGSRVAMNSYGVYLEYKSKERSQEEAKKWYKKSADLGYIKGMLNYSRILDQGIRDYRYALRNKKKTKMTKTQYEEAQKEALKYYQIAAEQGNRNAMYFYALYLEHGNGIDADKEKAVQFYLAAAEKGHSGAMSNYARCLEHGIGIKQNRTEALKWYKRSAKYGHRKAEQDYEYLLNLMKKEQQKIDTDEDDDEINLQDEEEDDDDDDDDDTNAKRKKVSDRKDEFDVNDYDNDDDDENENNADDSDIENDDDENQNDNKDDEEEDFDDDDEDDDVDDNSSDFENENENNEKDFDDDD